MSAAGLPQVSVLLDDVNNGGTWPYDISAYARLAEGYQIVRGRADELSEVAPATLTLTLDNTDGRFSLGSTSGGYGAINVDRKIRLSVTPTGQASVTRFTGWVQSWPVEWPDGTDRFALTQVTATDAMARWQRRTLRSMGEEEVLLSRPLLYYTLGEPAGASSASDSSGNNGPALTFAGKGSPVVFGTATGPPFDALTAAKMQGGQFLSLTYPAGFQGFECTFLRNGAPASDEFLLQSDYMTIRIVASTGKLSIESAGGSINVTAAGYCDNATHVLSLNGDDGTGIRELFIDGASILNGAAHPVSHFANVGQFTGTLSHVSFWPGRTLSNTRGVAPSSTMLNATAHYQGLMTGFDGEAAGRRVQRLVSYEGSADASSAGGPATAVPYIDYTGTSVGDAIQQVSDAEGSPVSINGDGSVAFSKRTLLAAATSTGLTLDANTDIVTDLQVVADTQQLANYATGQTTADGAPRQLWEDAVSEATHGRYPQDITYAVTTDAEVLSRAQWTVSNYSQPRLRYSSLTLDLLTADASVQRLALLNGSMTLTNLPTQGAGSIDLVQQGSTETLNLGEWSLQVNASAFAINQAWVLGNATLGVLGSTTRLFY